MDIENANHPVERLVHKYALVAGIHVRGRMLPRYKE